MNLNLRKQVLLVSACMALGLVYSPKMFAALPTSPVAAAQQAKKVTGSVSDVMGPVVGASVKVKGSDMGTITDLDGNFSVNVDPGTTLVISYIGYKTQEVNVGNRSNLDIRLVEDNTNLEGVVVVGYGVQKKKLVTGATDEVTGEDVAKLNTTQVLGALQSQTPGVTILSVSGQPGDSYKVNIRGIGSSGTSAPIYVIDGVAGGDINALNPADIERIDVLKDAASCAIYGSSGANGVILITTKQGKAGKITVSYDGNIGWQNVYKMPDMLDAKEYMAIMDQVNVNSGRQPFTWTNYMTQEQYDAFQDGTNKGMNWLEAIRNNNAMVTNHAINISGGSEMSKFSTGIGYQYQDGVFGGPVKSDFSRFTFRLNSEHVIYKKGDMDVVKFGENLYYQHRQNQGIQIGNQYANNLSNMLRANPLIPEYNDNGEYYAYDDLLAAGWLNYNPYSSNPVANMVWGQSGNNANKSFNLNAVGYIEIQPIRNLVYRGQISYKQYSSSWRSYLPVYQLNNSGDIRTQDSGSDNMSLGWSWVLTNTLDYKFNVAKKHNFDILGGTEYTKSRPGYGESVNVTAYGNIFGDFPHSYMHNFSHTGATVDGFPADFGAKMSYFARLNYDFNETYMLTAIIRADGSSKFPTGKQWGYFPSFSAGWIVTNEKWMESAAKWLDYLKIRASWGENGNDNIPSYSYNSGFDFGAYGMYSFDNDKNGGTQGAYPNRLSNPDLTWETSQQTDIGIDVRLFGQRLTFTADWYNKVTKNLLLYVQTPAISGFSNVWKNAGTVKNTGVELALGWQDHVGQDFNYGANFNISFNSNEVTAVNGENDYIDGGNDLLAQSTGTIARFWEGHPIGVFYGFKTEGVIQNQADLQAYLNANCDGLLNKDGVMVKSGVGNAANSIQGANIAPGDLKFVDYDGNGIINAADKTAIGDPNPDITMGFSFNVGYKGFDLAVATYGAFGQQVARSWRKYSDGQYENYTTEVYEYWHGEGTSNRYPLLAPGNMGQNWQQISDIFIDDASYFRIQNVTLGYDFKRLIKNCPFQQLRLYVAAQNLFTFTGYSGMDPENGMALDSDEPWVTGVDVGNYPQPRTIMVGVNIKF